jgi:hypothetical protein
MRTTISKFIVTRTVDDVEEYYGTTYGHWGTEIQYAYIFKDLRAARTFVTKFANELILKVDTMSKADEGIRTRTMIGILYFNTIKIKEIVYKYDESLCKEHKYDLKNKSLVNKLKKRELLEELKGQVKQDGME